MSAIPVSGATPARSSTNNLLLSVLRAAAIFIVFGVLAFAYRRFSLTFPTHSDYANFVLQADEVASGNVLLRNWYLTTVSYYTSDVLFFSIGRLIRGFRPALMHEVPAAAFTVIVALSCWLASQRRDQGRSFRGSVITLVLLGFPALALAAQVLMGTLHTGMMLLVLCALVALDAPTLDKGIVSPLRLLFFGIFMTMAVLADTMALYVAVVPLAIAAGVNVWRTQGATRTSWLWVLGVSLVSSPLAVIFLRLIRAVGGFKMPDMYANHASVVTFDKIGENIGNTIETVQIIYNGDFWGMAIGKTLPVYVLGCIAPTLILFGSAIALRRWWQAQCIRSVSQTENRALPDFMSIVLALIIVVNLFVYTFSNLQVGLETTRYLVPMAIAGAILVGRWGAEHIPGPRYLSPLLLALYALVALPLFAKNLLRPQYLRDADVESVAALLQSRGIQQAYGEYWSSSHVTVYSNKAVLICPIINENNTIAPCLCSIDERWYQKPVHAVVTGPGGAYGITRESVTKIFGKPDEVRRAGIYEVLFYNKDLSPLLKPSSWAVQ